MRSVTYHLPAKDHKVALLAVESFPTRPPALLDPRRQDPAWSRLATDPLNRPSPSAPRPAAESLCAFAAKTRENHADLRGAAGHDVILSDRRIVSRNQPSSD